MNQQSISDYSQELTCIYKEETYSVRDNGAIIRHPRKEGRIRVLDAVWTFGKVNSQKGYLEIGNIAIHRIVAIAFLGPPPTVQHVVDHIDTNRQNNRPENLHWVTRFENIILNEITRKKIELLCGCSIEEILRDISILHNASLPTQYYWMRTVTADEAKASLQRWNTWVERTKPSNVGMALWEENIRKSRTYHAAQKDWYQSGVFPRCPTTESQNTLHDYQANLEPDAILYQRDQEVITVIESAINNETQSLNIKCSRVGAVKKHCLIIVTLQNGWFIHSIRAYFDHDSLEKYYTIAQGKDWEGGEVFDDYC